MKMVNSIFAAGSAILFLSLSASADPRIDTHVQMCVNEGGQQTVCFCTATAIRNIGVDDEQYERVVQAVEIIGHSPAMELFEQALAEDAAQAEAFNAAYQACSDQQGEQE